MYFIVIEIENMIKYNYRYILGVVEGVSGSPVVLHHSPGALATTRLPLDTQQHLFLIAIMMLLMMILRIMVTMSSDTHQYKLFIHNTDYYGSYVHHHQEKVRDLTIHAPLPFLSVTAQFFLCQGWGATPP